MLSQLYWFFNFQCSKILLKTTKHVPSRFFQSVELFLVLKEEFMLWCIHYTTYSEISLCVFRAWNKVRISWKEKNSILFEWKLFVWKWYICDMYIWHVYMYMLNKFVCRHLYIYMYVETPEANTGYCFSDVSNVMTKYHHKVTERR